MATFTLIAVQHPHQNQWPLDNDECLYAQTRRTLYLSYNPGSCRFCACGTEQVFGVENVGR